MPLSLHLERAVRLLTPGLMVFGSAIVFFSFTLNYVWAADHPNSLLDLAYAMWVNHSPVLGPVGQFVPNSVDVFPYGKSYYSALAPGGPALSLPFTGLAFTLNGGFSVFGYPMILSELFVSICNAVAAYLVFKLSSLYFSQRTAAFVALSYAFSTIAWPFATYFFESDVSGMFDILGVYLALRMARSGEARLRPAVLCGLAFAAALTVDYLNILLVPVVLGFLVYTFKTDLTKSVPRLVGMALSSGVGVLLLALYNYAAFGNPLTTTEQAYRHASSVFGSFSYPVLTGLYLNLFSPERGLFLFCPVLIAGAVGLYMMSQRPEFAAEYGLLAACFVALLIPYSMWYDAAGGEGFGQRFLIPVIPFLLVPSGFVVESRRRGSGAFVYFLYATGAVFNGLAAMTNAIPQVADMSKFPFLNTVVPTFVSGTLETWWWRDSGHLWWLISGLILATVILLPLATGAVGRRKEAPWPPEQVPAAKPS